jgi:HK97 family phage prohead protease
MIKLTAAETFVTAEEGENIRSISGIAVPWNTEATVSDGTRVKFLPGSLAVQGKKPKLLKYHDSTQPVGIVTGRMDTERGMLFTAKISKTRDGDDVVELIKDGAIDAVSVGVNPIDASYDETGALVVAKGEWLELSLVTAPAFAGAQITEVAAAEATEQENPPVEATKEIKIESAALVTEAPAAAPTAPLFAEARRAFQMPSIGEWLVKVLAGGSEAAEFHAKIKAAAPDVTTSDTPGILPEPLLGPVYNNYMPNWRPLVTAMGVRALPGGGKVFRRPKVTTHTTIGASNGENANLDQGTFVVSNNNVTKQVFGGYVRLSEEDMDWTEPEVLGLLVDDMARIYANETDAYACAQFEAGVSQTATLTSATDPANWAAFVYEAAKTILTNSNGNLPNVLIMDPLYYSNLGALVDTADRPLFPNLNPQNAFGSLEPGSVQGTAFGLTVVVDKNLVLPGGNNLYVGASDGFEIYEQQKGALQVEAADGSLSRYIKFRGYFATLMIDDTKFVTRA